MISSRFARGAGKKVASHQKVLLGSHDYGIDSRADLHFSGTALMKAASRGDVDG